MNFELIREYYDNHIKPYIPYNNSILYDKLFDYLCDVYTKDLYINIPATFKSLYEDNDIPDTLYDQILISIGVPQKLIDILFKDDKIKFIALLADFQRIKGSVNFIKSVASSFGDSLDIYALYIDINEHNTWILKPRLIYKGSKTEKQIETLIVPYLDVYYKIPSILLHTDQLNYYKDTCSVIFPLKTNLILLDYDFDYNVTSITGLVISSILKEYGNHIIGLTFSDDYFSVALRDVYLLWYYILTNKYNITWNLNIPISSIVFDDITAYTLSELSIIYNEYLAIDSIVAFDDFYNKYLSPIISTYKSEGDSNKDEIRHFLNENYPDLVSYIDTRLFSEDSVERELVSVCNEIISSLINFQYSITDQTFHRFFDLFLKSLPQIYLSVSDTVSYQILYNLKPFHDEFITRHTSNIVSDDKSNILTPYDDLYFFDFQHVHTDFVSEIGEQVEVNCTESEIFPLQFIDPPTTMISNETINLEVTGGQHNLIWSINNDNFTLLHDQNEYMSTVTNSLTSLLNSYDEIVNVCVDSYDGQTACITIQVDSAPYPEHRVSNISLEVAQVGDVNLNLDTFISNISLEVAQVGDVIDTEFPDIEPDINIFSNLIFIPIGDLNPSIENNRDFGSIDINTSITHIFTIINNGITPLSLTGDPIVQLGGDNPESFTVIDQPSPIIESFDETIFSISFNPITEGEKISIISIDNNDTNKTPYTFMIKGVALMPIPSTPPLEVDLSETIYYLNPSSITVDKEFELQWVNILTPEYFQISEMSNVTAIWNYDYLSVIDNFGGTNNPVLDISSQKWISDKYIILTPIGTWANNLYASGLQDSRASSYDSFNTYEFSVMKNGTYFWTDYLGFSRYYGNFVFAYESLQSIKITIHDYLDFNRIPPIYIYKANI